MIAWKEFYKGKGLFKYTTNQLKNLNLKPFLPDGFYLDVSATVVPASLSQVAQHGLSLVLLLQRLLVEERSNAEQRNVAPLKHTGLQGIKQRPMRSECTCT